MTLKKINVILKLMSVPSVSSNNKPTSSINTASKPTVEEILKKQNLTIDDLIKCGKEGLTAVKRMYDRDGDLIDDPEPDYNVRHKFFASFLELLGLMKKDSVSVQVVNISAEERALLDAYSRNNSGEDSTHEGTGTADTTFMAEPTTDISLNTIQEQPKENDNTTGTAPGTSGKRDDET